jgi:hypothetical protein
MSRDPVAGRNLLLANLATGRVCGSFGGAAAEAHLLSRKAGACACSPHRAHLEHLGP